MGERKAYINEFTVTVSASAINGSADEPCNPVRGLLKSVQVKCAADTAVSGLKIELMRPDNFRIPHDDSNQTYTTVYTGSDTMIPDDDSWHDVDSDKNLEIPMDFANDGYYRWRITPDMAPAAELTVYVRRTIYQ